MSVKAAVQARHRTLMQGVLVLAGAVALFLTAGFFLQWPPVTRLWPWPDASLSYTFIASIFAAVAAPVIWLGLSGDFGAARGGAINLGVVFAGAAVVFAGWLGASSLPQWGPALTCLAGVVLNGMLFVWTRKLRMLDSTPTPPLVRFSFAFFTLALITVGMGLFLHRPVFPWGLDPASSTIFSFAFFGAAYYFGYGVVRPCWSNAVGQLLSFLAYDLVLIIPYLMRLLGGEGEGPASPYMYGSYGSAPSAPQGGGTLSLVLYILVLLYSAALAVYHLMIHPRTRLWSRQQG
ncbi:hypothetical protein [Deinococcus cellulosilyticus]|uniref:Uncharacterized protein n=1 Tax=Deinococcus cellulosilyticus (strain DSM 18568 / NBRC 106333 / KACC 11606 / 5516J-15) TaxID=1223518 RepID=A0A511N679_DEIC1|nr:hypothetical protein [Deinococcus cellulosilyticus]GEM48354.1 hypothetical protein DC3_39890 [Deinococcus cellulosilyticus NBRC 106333 = KACC 11606]